MLRQIRWAIIGTAVSSTLLYSIAQAAEVGMPPTHSSVQTAGGEHPLPRKITTVEGVTEYRLANGLQVLLAPDPSKPTTTVNITYRVGSRMESYGETGMAHLLEHLMFKGTPAHRNIMAGLTERGMRPNGTTWFDRTNYFESFPASPQNLDWALRMEADRMVHSFIARKDLDSEMTVVRNEMERGENEPGDVLMDKIMAAAFQWHNYGKSTIGARSDVENVNIPHLQAFYHKYYQPDNATVVVAGQFDPAHALRTIQASLGAIPRPPRTLDPTYTLDPVQEGERQVILRRVGEVQYVEAVYHAVAAASPDSPAFEVLAQVLGDTPSGRLHKALVEPGLATSVGSDYFNLDEPGVIFMQAEVRKDQKLDAVRDSFLATIEDLHDHPVTQVELDRARATLLNDQLSTFNDPEKFGIALSTAIANGDWRLFFLNRDRLNQLTLADVQRVADTWLISSNRTLGLFIPTDHPMRAPAPIRVDAETALQDYHGNPDFQVGEAFDTSPNNIQQQTQWVTGPEGLRMALLPKKTRGGTVHAQLALHFGTAESLKGQEQVGNFVAELLDRGAAGMSREAIQDRFTALKAEVSFTGSATGVTVTIKTLRDNLPAVLDQVIQILRHPEFPASEFKQVRESQLASVEENRSEPQAIAGITLHRYFNLHPRGDLRYTSTFDETAEDIKAVTSEQVTTFHHRFYGAGHGELAVVGDFDPTAVQAVLGKGLTGWTTTEPYETVLDDFQAFPGKTLQVDVKDKANAVFLAWQPLPIKDDDGHAPALNVGNYVLGEGFLNSRLATRIRQKEGLSYGVGSFLRLNDKVPNSAFGAYAIYAPQNRGRLTKAFDEVVATARKDGLTGEEVTAARQALLHSHELARAQDGSLCAQLDKLMFDHRDMLFVKQQEEGLAAVTADDASQALQQYLDPGQFVQVYVGDFKAPAAP